MAQKEKELEKILKKFGSAVVAFSGGVDSSYLLYKAKKCLGENLLAVTAVSEVFRADEQEKARRVAQEIGVEHLVVPVQLLASAEFAANPPARCYHCKREFFSRFKQIAARRKIAMVCDGANADDSADFRPGQQAASQFQVRSPLQEAGLSKAEIRLLAKGAGLSTWDWPASPCLATRLPYGEEITLEKLQMIAAAEKFLYSLGHYVLRVRYHKGLARIEVPPEMIPAAVEKREIIVDCLKDLGFAYVALDLQGFRSGSMNETLL